MRESDHRFPRAIDLNLPKKSYLRLPGMSSLVKDHKSGGLVRDKGRNTPKFNIKVKKRRAKAKEAAKSRKINRRK